MSRTDTRRNTLCITLCAKTGLPSTMNVTSDSSWLSSRDLMSFMNDEDMELNAGVDILAPASAAVCSLYDATCRRKIPFRYNGRTTPSGPCKAKGAMGYVSHLANITSKRGTKNKVAVLQSHIRTTLSQAQNSCRVQRVFHNVSNFTARNHRLDLGP